MNISLHKRFKIPFLFVLVLVQSPELISGQSGSDVAGRNVREWEQLKYGMFIHFNMNTFAGAEYDNGKMPAASFNPSDPDVDQWIRIARDAGMKYVVLTAKHTGGFCLWDSKVIWKGKEYDYDIASSGYRKDMVALFMESCSKYSIRPALYYCLWDDHNEPVSSMEEYFQLAKGQIEELVTNYNGLVEIWIDIPSRITRDQRVELYNIVKTRQPNCLVTCNNGFTDGSVLSFFPADITNGERTLPPVNGHQPVREIDGKKYYIPMEVCQTINQNWFWLPGDVTKSVRTLYHWYSESIRRGANLLLDVPPDPSGRIPQGLADRLLELKDVIDKPEILPPLRTLTGYKPAAASSVFEDYAGYLPEYAVDEDPNTRWVAQTKDSLPVLTVDMGEERWFNTVVLMEPYDSHIIEFEIQYLRGDNWISLFKGTTVGSLLIKKFPQVGSRLIRIVVTGFRTGENPFNAISVPGVPPPVEGVTLSEFQVIKTESSE
jgi:alpha-L-fucosidase